MRGNAHGGRRMGRNSGSIFCSLWIKVRISAYANIVTEGLYFATPCSDLRSYYIFKICAIKSQNCEIEI